jgi:hypothetical protein
MSLKDFVIAAGDSVATAATGILAIANSNISVGDLCIAQFATAVGTASAAVQLRCVTADGSATITAVDAAGAAVAVAVRVSYVILRPSAAGFVSA